MNNLPVTLQNLNTTETDLITIFIARYQSPHTRRAYQTDLQHFARIVLQSDRIRPEHLHQINPEHLAHYCRFLVERGCAPATVNRKMASLATFFQWTEDVGLLPNSPYRPSLIKRPRVERHRHVVTLSEKEAEKLLLVAAAHPKTGPRDVALIHTMLYTWLRRSEVVRMRHEHIRRLGDLYILHIPNPKGGGEDFIKISEKSVELIQAMCKHYGWQPQGPIWRSLAPGREGTPLSNNGLYHVVLHLVQRAGLRAVTPHTLRHTGITLAVEKNAPIEYVRRHARHADLSTTMRYVHMRDILHNCPADLITIAHPEKNANP